MLPERVTASVLRGFDPPRRAAFAAMVKSGQYAPEDPDRIGPTTTFIRQPKPRPVKKKDRVGLPTRVRGKDITAMDEATFKRFCEELHAGLYRNTTEPNVFEKV